MALKECCPHRRGFCISRFIWTRYSACEPERSLRVRRSPESQRGAGRFRNSCSAGLEPSCLLLALSEAPGPCQLPAGITQAKSVPVEKTPHFLGSSTKMHHVPLAFCLRRNTCCSQRAGGSEKGQNPATTFPHKKETAHHSPPFLLVEGELPTGNPAPLSPQGCKTQVAVIQSKAVGSDRSDCFLPVDLPGFTFVNLSLFICQLGVRTECTSEGCYKDLVS